MAIQKILIPIVLAQIPRAILRQAAFLCRQTGAEIILLHVVSPHLEAPGPPGEAAPEPDIITQAEEAMDKACLPELDHAAVSRLVCFGDPARQIVQTAREHHVDLIMLMLDARWRIGEGWGGPRVFQRFLLRSVAARVVEEAPCAVWTVRDDAPPEGFGLRRILCYLDLAAHNRELLSRTAGIAAACHAALLLVHFTPSMEISVPGGSRFARMWHETFTASAKLEIAQLQSEAGTQAQVHIENGGGPPTLIPALEKTSADLLVVGHFTPQSPSEDYVDIHRIMRNAPVPVLISKGVADTERRPDNKAAAAGTMPVTNVVRSWGTVLRRPWVVLAILAFAIVLGVGLLEAAFYTTLHPTGMCSSDLPNCDFTLKPGEAGRAN